MDAGSGNKAGSKMNLKPRPVFAKPATTKLAGAVLHNVFILKWAEGTHIRARDGIFVFDPSALSSSEKDRLARAGLDHKTVKHELDFVNNIFKNDPELQFREMFERPEPELEKEKEQGEAESGEELADLKLYFYILLKKIGFNETEKLIDQLNALKSVEIAYPQHIPFPARDIPPETPDFRLSQSYLEPAPQGIDAYYAWAFSAGKGAFAQIIDVETGWHLDHEDLPPERSLIHNHGWHWAYHDHGTAVLGILAAQHNDFGIAGIVPNTGLGVDSPVALIPPFDIPGSINRACAALARGGIVLIEQQYPSGPSATPLLINSGTLVPVEVSQGDFDAIRNATARGIVVVEAAANGGQDLDVPFFQGRFDRAVRDSGAILVGAGRAYTGDPLIFSDFGRRVDVQGWGNNVMTLSYENLVTSTGDVRQQYTMGFSGTSSASPIVAGAAAAIQSIRRFHGLPTLTSVEMRTLLRDTGTPGLTSTRNIGPLPNLRRAINSMRLPGLPAAGWSPFSDFPTDTTPVVVRNPTTGALTCFVVRAFRLWWRTQGGPFLEWGSWLRLGDQPVVGGLTAVMNAAGCWQVFVRGVDRAMWTIRQLFPDAGSAWSPWISLDGMFSGDPVSVVNAVGELELFARGLDDQLYTNFQRRPADPWNGWMPLGGRLASKPAVLAQPDGSVTVVVTFKDRSVRSRTRNAGGMWDSDWVDSGGLSLDEPSLTSNSTNGIDVFVRGLDRALWHIQRTGNIWSTWSRLAGELAPHTAPTVALSPFGKVHAFVRWQDNTVHFTSQSDDAPFWSPLNERNANLAGSITSNLVVVFHSDGRYELYALTWNGTIITASHRSRN